MDFTLYPCGDTIDIDESNIELIKKWDDVFDTNFFIYLNQGSSAFSQINELLGIYKTKCPYCNERIIFIGNCRMRSKKFVIGNSILDILYCKDISIDMNTPSENINISFKRIHKSNILNEGTTSNDSSDTFRRMSEIANDCDTLISVFGSILGRLVYRVPIGWKASVYIREIDNHARKKLPFASWLMMNSENDDTIGIISLSKVDADKFQLEGEKYGTLSLDTLNLYTVGILLHSKYQRRGITSELYKQLFEYLQILNFDIDGLWIATRPNNIAVNHLANRLGFTFLKSMQIKANGLIPCFTSTYTTHNIYIKLL